MSIPYPSSGLFIVLGAYYKKEIAVTLKISNKSGSWCVGKVPASLFSPTRALFSGPPRRPRPAHPPLHPMCYSSGPRAAGRPTLLHFTPIYKLKKFKQTYAKLNISGYVTHKLDFTFFISS